MPLEQVQIRIGDEAKSVATVTVEHLTFFSRLRRTAIRGGFVALLSLLLIAIPILHFLLVPLGLIVALVIAIRTFSIESLLLDGSGPCPMCNGQIKIHSRNFRLPFPDVCEHCHRAVLITAAD